MPSICTVGTGYVGLVSGACLADFGNSVVCIDLDEQKIKRLQGGDIPIYEPGLEEVISRNVKAGRLSFSTDSSSAIANCEVVFIAVGTPPAGDGSADLKYVESAARDIGRFMTGYRVVVDKSTVPIGTARKVRIWIGEELGKRGAKFEFDVVSNPEFLREGTAVYDFTHPDRVVLGVESERARNILRGIYRVLYLNETPFIETGLESAEMIKYAANAFLAVKISYINEIANLCEQVGADIKDVAIGMGKDGRIGSKFLHPGPGYGGSCFPKDTKAITEIAARVGRPLRLVEAAIAANEAQKARMVEKAEAALGGLEGRTIAVLGLAFKQNTDDMRESPAITIVEGLIRKGARIRAFDPKAMEEARWRLSDIKDKIVYCSGEYEALEDADALMILTEWNQFRNLDLLEIRKSLKRPVFLDFRNLYDRVSLEKLGFTYDAVGR